MKNYPRPFISVVIPTYNHAKFLRRSLQSLIDQTYGNWEAIVVDNYSTDNTNEVVRKFNDPRIHYLKIKNYGVIATSRNAGIDKANGNWVAFLDSDDWWSKEKLEVCIEYMQEKTDVIYHPLEISPPFLFFGTRFVRSRQVNSPVLSDLLVKGNALSTSSVVVRSELLRQVGGMNESIGMIAAEDYNTWLRIAQLTEGFVYIPRRLGYYQVHAQGVSSRRDVSVPIRCAISAFLNLVNLEQKNNIEVYLQYTSARYNYLVSNFPEAERKLINCVGHGNWQFRLKVFWMLLNSRIFQFFKAK